MLGSPSGGGLHFLPDGSVLIVGHVGLRRTFPDGRVALLADGKETGEEVSIAMATLPLWRIEVGDKTDRYLSVDVPAVAIKGFEIEGPFVVGASLSVHSKSITKPLK